MDNKQQQRADSLERPHGDLPSDMKEADLKEGARRYKAHQKAITRGLKRFYDDVAAEPVPDEFMALLKKMDEGTR